MCLLVASSHCVRCNIHERNLTTFPPSESATKVELVLLSNKQYSASSVGEYHTLISCPLESQHISCILPVLKDMKNYARQSESIKKLGLELGKSTVLPNQARLSHS